MGELGHRRTGELVRTWRRIRGLSQVELARLADTSTRNLSFIENGRALPSEEMLQRLAGALNVPPRERLLLQRSAGYGPAYAPIDLSEPEMARLGDVIDTALQRIDPLPAMVLNRRFQVLRANAALGRALAWFVRDPARLVQGSINLLEMLIREDGLRPYLRNWEEVARNILHRRYRDSVFDDSDGSASEIYERLMDTEGVPASWRNQPIGNPSPLVRFEFEKDGRSLRFDSLATSVGTLTDVTFQEVRIRYFVPGDDASERFLDELAQGSSPTAVGAS